MGHTRGPWGIESLLYHHIYVKGAENDVVVADCGVSLVEDRETKIANARLIAAAPALLSACRYAINMESSPMGTMYELPRVLSTIRDAIAKAESV